MSSKYKIEEKAPNCFIVKRRNFLGIWSAMTSKELGLSNDTAVKEFKAPHKAEVTIKKLIGDA